MINFLYRLFLTFNATSLIIVIYLIKMECFFKPFWGLNEHLIKYISYFNYLLIPIILTYISLKFASFLSNDIIEENSIIEVEQANNAYLPSYLGYFFVALSIPNIDTLLFVYIVLFFFTFLSQTLYFNPLFLIFGYHFFYIKTSNNVRIFIITKEQIKKPLGLNFSNLKRINNFTFIDL